MYNVDPVASVRYSWCTMCILSRCSLMYNMYPIEIIPDVLPPLPLNAPHRRLPSCWLPARAFHLLFTCSWGSDPLFSFVSLSFFLCCFSNFTSTYWFLAKSSAFWTSFIASPNFETINGSKPRVAINTVRCTKSVEHPFLGLSKTNRYNQLHFQVHLYCRQIMHTKCIYRDTRTVYFCKSTKQYVGTRVGIDCILVHFVHFCKSMKRYVGTIVGIDCILPPLLSLI